MNRHLAWLALLPCLLVPVAPARASDAGAREPACGDFLAASGLRPPHVEFIGCEAIPAAQGKPLRATYRVGGRHAAQAEAFLVGRARMARLRRSCCQWDNPPRQFVGAGRRDYTITMVSEETTVGSRRQWPAITSFSIVVDLPTEEP